MNLSAGKTIRMKRLIQEETNSCIIVAIDHGMTSPVFLEGLYDTGARISEAISGGGKCSYARPGNSKTTHSSFPSYHFLSIHDDCIGGRSTVWFRHHSSWIS